MKNNKLKVGILCTIREGRYDYAPEEDRGYWVVLAFSESARKLAKDDPTIIHWVKAFSLTHQQHRWRHPNDLIPVVKSGV